MTPFQPFYPQGDNVYNLPGFAPAAVDGRYL